MPIIQHKSPSVNTDYYFFRAKTSFALLKFPQKYLKTYLFMKIKPNRFTN